MSNKEEYHDEIFDEFKEEISHNSKGNRAKNAHQYKVRWALEDKLEEKRLNILLGLGEYAFDEGDEL